MYVVVVSVAAGTYATIVPELPSVAVCTVVVAAVGPNVLVMVV